MCLCIETKKKTKAIEGDRRRRHRCLDGCTYAYLTKEGQGVTTNLKERRKKNFECILQRPIEDQHNINHCIHTLLLLSDFFSLLFFIPFRNILLTYSTYFMHYKQNQ